MRDTDVIIAAIIGFTMIIIMMGAFKYYDHKNELMMQYGYEQVMLPGSSEVRIQKVRDAKP